MQPKSPRTVARILMAFACATVVVACGGGGGGGATPPTVAPLSASSSAPTKAPTAPTPTTTATTAPTAAPTHGATPTAAPTHTATPTPVPTATATATATATPSATPTPNLAISPVPAKAADSIVDMLGVNTHFSYTNTAYQYLTPSNPAPNGQSILGLLKRLGIRHLRDGDVGMATNPALCPAFQAAVAAGTDADILVNQNDTLAALSTITNCVGSGLRAIEGLNELDLVDPNYASDDVAFMNAISAARGTSFPSNVELFAPSLANACTSYAAEAAVNNDAIATMFDYNNAHIYFSGYPPENSGFGSVPCAKGTFGSEPTDLAEAQIPAPTKPVVVTETGYPDDCCGFSDPGFVSPAVKTTYTLRTILTHFLGGARYAYFYELASEAQSYGLTDTMLNPKPAFVALENFIAILADPGGASVSGSLRYSLSAGSAPVSQVLLEKRDGSFWLILWQPSPSWNPVANAPIAVAPTTRTITFGQQPTALCVYTFDPASGSVTPTTGAPAVQLTLAITDTPQIVQIGATTSTPVLAGKARTTRRASTVPVRH